MIGRSRASLLLVAVLACEPGAPPPAELDDVTFEDERRIDLTGDGRIERVIAEARGPTWDSLHIQLRILGEGDSLLYHDGWSSFRYFDYETGGMPADTVVQRIVRGHLAELLRDTAFGPPAIIAGEPAGGVAPDADAVRYDIAEYSWRRSAGLPDTVSTPAPAWTEIEELLVPESDVESVVAELARQPTFTYHAGGEVTHTLAWSNGEGRFIRIRSCC